MTLRRTPTDFTVRERVSPSTLNAIAKDFQAQHKHAIYRLSKVSLTTPDAVSYLARSIKIKAGSLSYAGLKDKHAATEQLVSAPISGERHASALPPAIASPSGNWAAALIGFSSEPILADAIEGNDFDIVVRDISKQQSDEISRRADLLALPADPNTLLITNYFGAQRFGSARHGQGWVARKLIDADFLGALKLAIGTPARKDSGATRTFTRLCANHWENWNLLAQELPNISEKRPILKLARGSSPKDAFAELPYYLQQLYVEAFQSYIWNRTLDALIRHLAHAHAAEILCTDDEYGVMSFPTSALSARREISNLQIPLLDHTSQLLAPWGDYAKAALASEGIAVEQLKIPGLRRPFFGHLDRPAFMAVQNFRATKPTQDELSAKGRIQRTLSFSLPRGCYATVVLRALGQ